MPLSHFPKEKKQEIAYISHGVWFDENTIAILIDDYRNRGLEAGLFLGTRNGKLDEEICSFEEFTTYTIKVDRE